jgi:predicted nuclease of restriction endonuclease-like (RecB) superfamily
VAGRVNLATACCQIAVGHVTVLLSRLKTIEDRTWYAERAVAEGWSRGVLEHHLKVNLRHALGEAPSTFAAALEAPDSDLAQQLVKDPCVFEHLALIQRRNEHALASAASPVAVADYYGLPDDARAALPSATELQAVITDEIARIDS